MQAQENICKQARGKQRGRRTCERLFSNNVNVLGGVFGCGKLATPRRGLGLNLVGILIVGAVSGVKAHATTDCLTCIYNCDSSKHASMRACTRIFTKREKQREGTHTSQTSTYDIFPMQIATARSEHVKLWNTFELYSCSEHDQ